MICILRRNRETLFRGKIVLRLMALFQLLIACSGTVHASSVAEVADQVLEWKTENSVYVRMRQGLPITGFRDISFEVATSDAAFARQILMEIETLDTQKLTIQDQVFLQAIQHEMESMQQDAQFFWLPFLITPYMGGDLHNAVFTVLNSYSFDDVDAAESYLSLVISYAKRLKQIAEKTRQQQERGILLPKPAIPNARAMHESLLESNGAQIRVDDFRLKNLSNSEQVAFQSRLESLITGEVARGYSNILSVVDDTYFDQAPLAVGLYQYEQGREYYEQLIFDYTGFHLPAEEIHETGMREIERIESELSRIRDEVGFTGSKAEFHEFLKTDERWIANSPEEVEQRYQAYIALFEPLVPEFFSEVPEAPYTVKRLDPANEAGQSFGYYQAPSPSDPSGYYRYNGSGLEQRSMYMAQHLIYHELIPGHHFMTAYQMEAGNDHELHKYLSSGAYIEGWGEYAPILAEDVNLFQPYDLYGHLMAQSFTAARLVVDTGMNALGWSLEEARDFMLQHTLESDALIHSELLRYSTDIPGQALSYLLGRLAFQEARERARLALGDRFDIRAYHAAVLETGSVPLKALGMRVNDYIRVNEARTERHIAANNTAGIFIKQPADRVWAVLTDRAAWNPNFDLKAVLAGTENQAGELASITQHNESGESYQRLEELLLVQPPRRLVIRLAPMSNAETTAIADFRLAPVPSGTQLEFSVSWFEDVDAGTDQEAAELEANYSESTQRALDTHLERIKQAAERSNTNGKQ